MDLGVFIPIGNNGWLISTTSPQYKPSFDLNLKVCQLAEKYGFEFALSMIKYRGFGGDSEFWDYNLESFTLMSAIAARTEKIKLFASTAVLTLPPPVVARMAATIDSIAPGRFGINIVSGWAPGEYAQMGLWPGDEYFGYRYEYSTEYVKVMQDLWRDGTCTMDGKFFQMDDCRCLPLPTAKIPIISAGQSEAGTQFAVAHADYNFRSGGGINQPTRITESVGRLVAANEDAGTNCGALVLTMVIADETDAAAMAKWEHYKTGTDHEAIAWRDSQFADDPTSDPLAGPNKRRTLGTQGLPTQGGVLIGSYASVARMLDELGAVPGVQGVMLTFDDFIIGMEQFGTRIQPLMRSRAGLHLVA